MMCGPCGEVAATNRKIYEVYGADAEQLEHPDCACPCQHKKAEQWEKMFSCKKPGNSE